mgnify:CR=1 FL=1|tara:strand:- start:605 stop:736 length:132 start_codon:yes stop_codon:yes gene_type:complete
MNFNDEEYKLILEALNAYLSDDDVYNKDIHLLIKKIISFKEGQ